MEENGRKEQGSVEKIVAARTDITPLLPQQLKDAGDRALSENSDNIQFEEAFQRAKVQHEMLIVALQGGEITEDEYIEILSALDAQKDIDSYIDSLTGCVSRKAGLSIGLKHIFETPYTNQPLVAIMVDIDKFKEINDKIDHAAGDKALQLTASYIRSQLRLSDDIIRYGGDEFLILLPSTTLDRGIKVAQRINKGSSTVIGSKMNEHDYKLDEPITLSMGIAQIEPFTRRALSNVNPLDVFSSAVEAADKAEGQAKRRDGNQIIIARGIRKNTIFSDTEGNVIPYIEKAKHRT